ncbi:MAG TPA: hypothetical protein DCM87_15265 [Planctomycetes bacterium]|nr:hypothetical protein [Planctomycetota bacterium]
MNRSARILKVLMIVAALSMLAALAPVFFPFAWMQAIHEALGLGALPELPIVEYMARSLSAFYACYGALVLYLAFDVARYASLIRFLGALGLLFGAVMVWVDIASGLPPYWALGEGPFILVLGAALYVLAGKVRAAAGARETTAGGCA